MNSSMWAAIRLTLAETEKVILEIEGVQQALVYGKANSILGNVLCAEVQLVEGSTLTELEIRNYLKEQLQDFKIPRRIKFVDSFSLTRTGKINDMNVLVTVGSRGVGLKL